MENLTTKTREKGQAIEGRREREDLSKVVQHILEESRMVLPGVQALFGFQLIAVFNKPFFEILNVAQQQLHVAALGLSALSIALLMAPAAYHRQVEPEEISEDFVRCASRFLAMAMVPLMVALSIDIYLICICVLKDWAWSLAFSSAIFGVFAGLWYVFPLARRWQIHHNRGVFQKA